MSDQQTKTDEPCVHLLSRWIDGVRGIYFANWTDAEFQALFWERKLVLPPGWKISHIPQAELLRGSPRVDYLKSLPIVTGWNGYFVTLKEAIAEIERLQPAPAESGDK
jgi:hypothetical protein